MSESITDAPTSLNPPAISHAPIQPTLPDEPLVVIQPSKSWVALNLRDVWAYRELLYFLAWRDVKVRYKQTALGVAWAILQPLLTMLISSLIFGRLGGFGSRSGGIPYPIFVYAGLLPWTFFSNAIISSGNSLVGSANLITKVYFPRMIIPGAAVIAGLVDFFIAFVLLIALMLYYRLDLTWNLLLFPVLVILTALLATGVGMWLSALNVKYRDIRFALPFMVQFWMFLSPVFYPSNVLPAKYRWAFALNPLTGMIDAYRSSLFGQPVNWAGLGISSLITIAILVYGSYTFRRMEKTFADIV